MQRDVFMCRFRKKIKVHSKFIRFSPKGAENKEVILQKLVSLFGVGTVNKHFHEDNWSF